ncbi:class I SAM-dependent methyltransferase [Brevibacterium sp. 'Marine']|uniref:class I SAM-dependent methyltransferase n=1 Tax=Brevibacterium sp. 'Marine' TaxID=2725563 RepID=UPI00145E1091|nr:class I SAM-dependent methyltransferase [Brevibacterium sp. 'Marine']
MPDACFSHSRLAQVYDPLDPDRSDLETYVNLATEFGAETVLDVGCGTGEFIARLVDMDVSALGVDPAAASLQVAQPKLKPGSAELVIGTASDVADDNARRHSFDMATMTANVAQVFLDNEEWLSTLRAIRLCLRTGGRLVFETRDPADRAWERWTKEATHRTVELGDLGVVEEWIETTNVEREFVTFVSPTIFHLDGERIDSTSTLRFRPRSVLGQTLSETGFTRVEVHDLPYAPSRGWLFIATAGS